MSKDARQLLRELDAFESHKDALYEALRNDLGNDDLRITYDMAVMRWARAKNEYLDALRDAVAK